jgi:hypothetical protein
MEDEISEFFSVAALVSNVVIETDNNASRLKGSRYLAIAIA